MQIKESFVPKAKVEMPESDADFIKKYYDQSGKNYLYYRTGVEYLRQCMIIYNPNENPSGNVHYELYCGTPSLEFVINSVNKLTIIDGEYEVLISNFLTTSKQYGEDRKKYAFRQEKEEELKASLQQFYNAICALYKFHQQRQQRLEHAEIREKYKKIVARLKDFANRLPETIDRGGRNIDYEKIGLANELLKGVLEKNGYRTPEYIIELVGKGCEREQISRNKLGE